MNRRSFLVGLAATAAAPVVSAAPAVIEPALPWAWKNHAFSVTAGSDPLAALVERKIAEMEVSFQAGLAQILYGGGSSARSALGFATLLNDDDVRFDLIDDYMLDDVA